MFLFLEGFHVWNEIMEHEMNMASLSGELGAVMDVTNTS